MTDHGRGQGKDTNTGRARPDPLAREWLAEARDLLLTGERARARELVQRALERHPDCAAVHVLLGELHLAEEEYVWAFQAFDRALELDRENPEAWVGLGEALLKLGRQAEALQSFRQLEELGYGNETRLGVRVARVLYREGLVDAAHRVLLRLVYRAPPDPDALTLLAYTLYASGRVAEARRRLREALRLDPRHSEARLFLGYLLHEAGNEAGALRELERVPPDEHWDPLSVWLVLDLKRRLEGYPPDDPALARWRARLEELDGPPDAVDHLLAEVETAFERRYGAAPHPASGHLGASPDRASQVVRVRTIDGLTFEGTMEEIVRAMRDRLGDPRESLSRFMHRMSQRIHRFLGTRLPFDSPESFLRAGERLGLLRIQRRRR